VQIFKSEKVHLPAMSRLPFRVILNNACQSINLQPVKSISVKFDPFHDSVRATRQFLFAVSTKKAVVSNPACILQTNIMSDRSPPSVDIEFGNGSGLHLKTEHLNLFEIITHFNSRCEEYAVAPQVVETSTSGKIGKVKSKGKSSGKGKK